MIDAHAAWFPDRARLATLPILENERIGRDTYRMRLVCAETAAAIVPGQFVMVRLPGCNDPLLGRPLALYDTWLDASGRPAGIDLVYLVVGKMTSRLALLRAADEITLWGPLGNGFPVRPAEHLVMVAGGIGQTPFPALARECLGLRAYGDPPRRGARADRVTLCYGVRTRGYLAGLEDFTGLGVALRLTTDDGSEGDKGFVTGALRKLLAESSRGCRVVACGPEAMLEASAAICREFGVACEVSLESPMACGLGICFSCAARVRDGAGGWDYRRTCVEGPVFDAQAIAWHAR